MSRSVASIPFLIFWSALSRPPRFTFAYFASLSFSFFLFLLRPRSHQCRFDLWPLERIQNATVAAKTQKVRYSNSPATANLPDQHQTRGLWFGRSWEKIIRVWRARTVKKAAQKVSGPFSGYRCCDPKPFIINTPLLNGQARWMNFPLCDPLRPLCGMLRFFCFLTPNTAKYDIRNVSLHVVLYHYYLFKRF